MGERSVSKTTIGVILAAAVFVIFAIVLWAPRSMWQSENTVGKIFVESPEVYTRERLVNDRLRQAVWLEKQLEATKGVLGQGAFRSLEGEWSLHVLKAASIKQGDTSEMDKADDEKSAEGESGNPTPSAKPKEEKRSPQFGGGREGSSTALFRAMNEYREQVRSELMQTQLDDRHDIEGNTLYRLNFNTTIVHGQSSNALAIVRVKLRHGLGENGTRGEDGAKKKAREDSYENLLNDWSQELEKRLNNAAESRVRTILADGSMTREQAEFYNWLRWRICKKLSEVSEIDVDAEGGGGAAGVKKLGEFLGFPHSGCNEYGDAIAKDLNDSLDGIIGKYVARFMAAMRSQNWFSAYGSVKRRLLTVGPEKARADQNTPLSIFRRVQQNCNVISSGSNGKSAKVPTAVEEFGGETIVLPCTEETPDRLLAVLGVIDLDRHLKTLRSISLRQGKIDQSIANLVGNGDFDAIRCGFTAEDYARRSIPGDWWDNAKLREITSRQQSSWDKSDYDWYSEFNEINRRLRANQGLRCFVRPLNSSEVDELAMRHQVAEFNHQFNQENILQD